MRDTFVIIVIIIGLLQGVFLLINLTRKRRNNDPNSFLLVLILTFLIVLVHKYLVTTTWVIEHIFFFYATFSTPLLIGPSFYLYIKSVLINTYKFKVYDILHLIPFVGFVIYFIVRILIGDNPATVLYMSGDMPLYVTILGSVKAIHVISYSIITYLYYLKHRKSQSAQNINKDLRLWLGITVHVFISVFVIGVISFLLGHFDLSFSSYLDDFPELSLVIVIYALSYFAIQHPIVFDFKPKYQGSTLSDKGTDLLHGQLSEVMDTEKPYLDSKLRLDTLAEMLKTSPNNLSRVINQKEGRNFQDYLNSYRVEALKTSLLNNSKQHLNILALGFEAGFSSKTVMNRIFKNATGLTPSEYQKKYSH